jgi:hypothetical protein
MTQRCIDFSRTYFDGPDVMAADAGRLRHQLNQVAVLMGDHAWRSLSEIGACTGYPEASIGARLRDLRKARFGSFVVERRRRSAGTFEYRVLPPAQESLESADGQDQAAQAGVLSR